MAKNSSFDIVSQIDFQEIDNAVNQTIKEVRQRYDLKDSKSTIDLSKSEKHIVINTKDDYSLKAIYDILQTKFLKRNLSLKVMKLDNIEPAAGGRLKQKINLQSGISKENAKKITKLIKDLKLKVNAQIMDEQVRVQGQKKDELQLVIKSVKEADLDFPVQFVNYK
ncbi:putative nucleotide-binding protein [bacterium BMS3Abin04]|nr:putative nucleotide-binding protein [bacterium BMS3Abin04]